MSAKKNIKMLFLYREQNGIRWNVVAIQLVNHTCFNILRQIMV